MRRSRVLCLKIQRMFLGYCFQCKRKKVLSGSKRMERLSLSFRLMGVRGKKNIIELIMTEIMLRSEVYGESFVMD